MKFFYNCLLIITLAATSGCSLFHSKGAYNSDQTPVITLSGYLENALNQRYPGNHIVVTTFNNQIVLTGQMYSLEDVFAVKKQVTTFDPNKDVVSYIQVNLVESKEQIQQDLKNNQKVNDLIANIKDINQTTIKTVTTNSITYILGRLSTGDANLIKDALNKQQIQNIVFVPNQVESKS